MWTLRISDIFCSERASFSPFSAFNFVAKNLRLASLRLLFFARWPFFGFLNSKLTTSVNYYSCKLNFASLRLLNKQGNFWHLKAFRHFFLLPNSEIYDFLFKLLFKRLLLSECRWMFTRRVLCRQRVQLLPLTSTWKWKSTERQRQRTAKTEIWCRSQKITAQSMAIWKKWHPGK